MTLRLSDEETELLRRQAELEGRSMHEVARLAILDRIRGAQVVAYAREGAERYQELLDRLRDA